MPTIEKIATLTKRLYLSNLTAKDGLAITPLISGQHGIGKSQIVKKAAKDLGGICLTVEGGSLCEGEITGLPIVSKDDDNDTEVVFSKYYVIKKIYKLQKFYYEKAKTIGLLDGRIKIREEENGNRYISIDGKEKLLSTALEDVERGIDNYYNFDYALSGKLKEELIEKGEIKPILLFIDEVNRTDSQTMKQLMNIILNKNVNGFDFPFFVMVISAINPSSQNSSYATNEMDDAQLDRFLKLKADANINEWIDYALSNNVNSEIVNALASVDKVFIQKDKSYNDESELTPTPRSWEMVAHIWDVKDRVNKMRFFTPEEQKELNQDIRVLFRGKVGDNAARTILEAINNKENNIKPEEILNGKSEKIDVKIVTKFKGLRQLNQKVITDNIVRYLSENIDAIIKKGKSGKPEGKAFYANFMAQLKEFSSLLDGANQLSLVKGVLKYPGLYQKVAKSFSKEVLATLMSFTDGLEKME